MKRIEDIINVHRKLTSASYTNSELIDILKDQNTLNFLNIIVECEKKYPEDNNQFLACCSSACSSELKIFQNCIKSNNNQIGNCLADSMKFEKCMTKYSDKILSILSKSHSFKV
jgi:hypothetical protein